MAKRPKKGEGASSAIAFILLALLALGLVSAMPWLLIVIVPLAACAVFGGKKDSKPQSKSASTGTSTGSSPLAIAVNRQIEIMNDCVSFVNTSANLQTVLSRYDLLLKTLQNLSEYEKNPAVSFPRELPSDALVRISGEKSEIMNRAIRRAYDDMLHKSAALKTEKGRKNRQLKFFDELNELMPSFPSATQEFAVQFINEHINDSLAGR